MKKPPSLMRAYAIYPEVLNLEEDSKRTEWYIIIGCWWIMTCVLLLWQLDRDFGNRYIRERLRFCAFSQCICQGIEIVGSWSGELDYQGRFDESPSLSFSHDFQ